MMKAMVFHSALPPLDRARQLRGHAMAGGLAAAADRADVMTMYVHQVLAMLRETHDGACSGVRDGWWV